MSYLFFQSAIYYMHASMSTYFLSFLEQLDYGSLLGV